MKIKEIKECPKCRYPNNLPCYGIYFPGEKCSGCGYVDKAAKKIKDAEIKVSQARVNKNKTNPLFLKTLRIGKSIRISNEMFQLSNRYSSRVEGVHSAQQMPSLRGRDNEQFHAGAFAGVGKRYADYAKRSSRNSRLVTV